MTLTENQQLWSGYHWPQRGDEWSAWWGSAEKQWRGSIRPRIAQWLPAGTLLEIATGYGRWTQFLEASARKFVGVDMTLRCIEFCRRRFAALPHCSFHLNDGRSLACVPDGSVDFVFSFDSLVHADEAVVNAYLAALARKMRPDAHGFIHHSNAGNCSAPWGLRDPDMTSEKFAAACARNGLACESQELVNWGVDELTDCFSVFTPGKAQTPRVTRNPYFMLEAERIKAAR